MSTRSTVTELSGSGNNGLSVARLIELDSVQLVADRISRAPQRGVVPRGNGYAHGDAAQNGGGDVVALGGPLASPDRITINVDSYTAQIPAGVTLDEVFRKLLYRGWFLPVSPDSRRMTIGGALATDSAGTNHVGRGTLASHVNAMWVVDGRGELLSLRPNDETSDMFWATIGGLGLTGVITAIDISIIPVTSAWMNVNCQRHDSLDDVLNALATTPPRDSYSSAWIDTTASGKSFGRGLVSSARHAPVTDLPSIRQPDALELGASGKVSTNRFSVRNVINNWTVRAFNEARFRAASPQGVAELQPISDYLHSRDSSAHLSRTYGKRGSVHYQMCVPAASADVIGRALGVLAEPGRQCLWAVVQRFGAGNPAPLSFPVGGWALDLEFPADLPELGRLLDDVDELVLHAGGRVNLAKDARIRPQLIDQFYPRISHWQTVRHQMDPHGRFASDMARRLSL